MISQGFRIVTSAARQTISNVKWAYGFANFILILSYPRFRGFCK